MALKHDSMIPTLRQRLWLRLAALAAVRFSNAAEAAEKRHRRIQWWNHYIILNSKITLLTAALLRDTMYQ